MRYCKLQNNKLQAPGALPNDFKGDGKTILGFNRLPDDKLAAYGFYPYQEPEYDPETQYLSGFELQDGAAVAVVSSFSDAVLWAKIRAKRDELLTASDWTQVADAPVDSEAWTAYRQQLRDLPETYATPQEVVWPPEP